MTDELGIARLSIQILEEQARQLRADNDAMSKRFMAKCLEMDQLRASLDGETVRANNERAAHLHTQDQLAAANRTITQLSEDAARDRGRTKTADVLLHEACEMLTSAEWHFERQSIAAPKFTRDLALFRKDHDEFSASAMAPAVGIDLLAGLKEGLAKGHQFEAGDDDGACRWVNPNTGLRCGIAGAYHSSLASGSSTGEAGGFKVVRDQATGDNLYKPAAPEQTPAFPTEFARKVADVVAPASAQGTTERDIDAPATRGQLLILQSLIRELQGDNRALDKRVAALEPLDREVSRLLAVCRMNGLRGLDTINPALSIPAPNESAPPQPAPVERHRETNTPKETPMEPKDIAPMMDPGNPTLDDACNRWRKELLDTEHYVRALVTEKKVSGEAAAQAMLAVRHLEDARMRLGKVIQHSSGGGKSVYDR